MAFVGERDLFLDVLVEAIGRSGFASWWVEWPSDHASPHDADVVVVSLGADGYSERVRRLVRSLARQGILAITLDASAQSGAGWTPAGTIWGIDPETAGIDDLVRTLRAAAAHRTADTAESRRAGLATAAWANARNSSILTMKHAGRSADDAHGRPRGAVPWTEEGRPVGGGDMGRQQ